MVSHCPALPGTAWPALTARTGTPRYDGEFYDSSNTFMMQLYDVGMSSMVVQEAYALAELADAIGRPEAAMLRDRGDGMSAKIRDELWDEVSPPRCAIAPLRWSSRLSDTLNAANTFHGLCPACGAGFVHLREPIRQQ